ncbi:PP2C family protein-serine/threonine phosphatase [Marichromatium bheemlicum]|uniref:Serine/threonine-protein phosphatase n=1 Tax=Marichromatium bheemlicum TaxID=365339 RepID=A0ABX1IAA8_9GAMM|nr:protein phosphatase 2C domain-containing protein [Marichromatium bheemlicum]NKN33036.1 serine/threonine-protein phosphatase [Marichromatium bheemlicum]
MAPWSKGLCWNSAGVTDVGRVRRDNQDAYLDRPDLGLWAVADGMGGHRDGAEASRLIVSRLGRLERAYELETGLTAVELALHAVNRELVASAEGVLEALCGSTVAALLAVGDRAALCWAGDSRIYRLRAGVLEQLSCDHTQVQALVEMGLLSPEEAELHPLSSVLVRAVGADAHLEFERRVEPLRAGDRYLLCSDGLNRDLVGEEIARILTQIHAAEDAAQALVYTACEAGGNDNVTAVVVDFSA